MVPRGIRQSRWDLFYGTLTTGFFMRALPRLSNDWAEPVKVPGVRGATLAASGELKQEDQDGTNMSVGNLLLQISKFSSY